MSDYEPPYRLTWRARVLNGALEYNSVLPPTQEQAMEEVDTLDGSNLEFLVSGGAPQVSIDGGELPTQDPPLSPSVPPADGGSIP